MRKFNPYVWLINNGMVGEGVEVSDLSGDILFKETFDIVHIHWFVGYTYFRNPFKILLRCGRLLKGLDRQKKLGAKLVYTAHDVVGHDTPWRSLERRFFNQFISRVDGVIYLSEVSVPQVREIFPQITKRQAIIPHCSYGNWYPDTVSRDEAREKLGLPGDATVLVHVGLIKRYKNVPKLLQAFREIPGNFRLLIGGRVLEEDLRSEIESLAAQDDRVTLKIGHLDDDEMQFYMRAADMAVLPYQAILNSGSAMLALTFDVPVLAPNVGSLPELRANISPDWVHLYDGAFDSQALKDGLDWLQKTPRSEKAPLDKLTVEAIAKQHSDFYRSLKN